MMIGLMPDLMFRARNVSQTVSRPLPLRTPLSDVVEACPPMSPENGETPWPNANV